MEIPLCNKFDEIKMIVHKSILYVCCIVSDYLITVQSCIKIP